MTSTVTTRTEIALFTRRGGRACPSAPGLRAAARERLQTRQSVRQFESPEDVKDFFRSCARLDGPETEPDWSDHLRVMNESPGRGVSAT